MAKILCIESAGEVCSVALSENGEVRCMRESSHERDHAKLLAPFIEQIFSEAGISAADLDAVAVSRGPGSYTSLRIGVSTAKGLCFASQKPLIAIGTLDSLAQLVLQNTAVDADTRICAMIDARRMEVYAALFDAKGNPLTAAQPVLIDEYSFIQELQQHKVIFAGSGAEKCKPIIQHPNAIFLSIKPSAVGLNALAQKAFAGKQFEDVAYFEPFYLKNFLATVAKNKFF